MPGSMIGVAQVVDMSTPRDRDHVLCATGEEDVRRPSRRVVLTRSVQDEMSMGVDDPEVAVD